MPGENILTLLSLAYSGVQRNTATSKSLHKSHTHTLQDTCLNDRLSFDSGRVKKQGGVMYPCARQRPLAL